MSGPPSGPWVRAVCETFGPELSNKECFLLFGVLHNCGIEFVNGDSWAPQTQRGAAHILAAIWYGEQTANSEYTHWYWAWNKDWGGNSVFGKLTGDDFTQLEVIRKRLEAHPSVVRVTPEADADEFPSSWPGLTT